MQLHAYYHIKLILLKVKIHIINTCHSAKMSKVKKSSGDPFIDDVINGEHKIIQDLNEHKKTRQTEILQRHRVSHNRDCRDKTQILPVQQK